jgi:hypothetical protein
MRRGLMGWNADELPTGALDERTARVRAAMKRDRLDALLIYTNNVRPSAVTYLTGFTPYWSDGVLLLGSSGAPVFATALSKRVSNWIRSTNAVSEIVNTPKPGAAAGQRLAAGGCRRVGVLELDGFPSGLYDDLVNAAPAVELIDASTPFAAVRRTVDATERKLIARADTLAVEALAQVDTGHVTNSGVAAGLVEKHARLGGAEEAYIAVAPDLDSDRRIIRVSRPAPLADRFALRASIAYKGSWVRRTRTFARDSAGSLAVARADAWLAQLVRSLEAGKPLAAQIAAKLADLRGAELKSWMVESCIGSYPLEVIASSRTPGKDAAAEGAFLVLTVELTIDGAPWVGAAPAFIG